MTTESARLARIRAMLAAVEPGRWSRAHDGEGCFLEAAGPMGELLPVARFHPGASDDEIAFATEAPDMVRFLLGLLDRCAAKVNELTGRERGPAVGRPAGAAGGKAAGARREADYAAECAMKCGEPDFKVFIEERHGLERPLTDDRVAQKVRSLLGVTSRKELNDGGRAAASWKAMRDDFATWRRRAR